MLEKKVKLTRVGECLPYYKRENGNLVIDEATQQYAIAGNRRQVVFESQDYRKDTIPITLFNDDAKGFNLPVGSSGVLQFTCEMREANSSLDGEVRGYADIKLINFMPEN